LKLKTETEVGIVLSDRERAVLSQWSATFGQLISLASETLFKWRLDNFLRVLEKAAKIRDQSGIVISPLPPKFVIRFMEHASQESDPSMQERWANLLVGATAAFDGQKMEFNDILSQLLLAEAILLRQMWLRTKLYVSRNPYIGPVFAIPSVNSNLIFIGAEFLNRDSSGIDQYGRLLIGEYYLKPDFTFSHITTENYHLNNLHLLPMLNKLGRLGLLSFGNLVSPSHLKVEWAGLTTLGYEFVSACEGGKE